MTKLHAYDLAPKSFAMPPIAESPHGDIDERSELLVKVGGLLVRVQHRVRGGEPDFLMSFHVLEIAYWKY